jgi:hypothetical protein
VVLALNLPNLQVNTGSGFSNILMGIYVDTDSNPVTLEIDKPNYSMNLVHLQGNCIRCLCNQQLHRIPLH